MQKIFYIRATLLLSGSLGLVGCGWVDSTGNQGTQSPLGTGIIVPITAFEASARNLYVGEGTALLEDTANRTRLTGDDRNVRDWQWEMINEGSSPLCEGSEGFDRQYIADNLTLACIDESDCNVDIQEIPDSEQTGFVITVPSLKAPIALTYALTAARDDGSQIKRIQTLCALSINEAPTVQDDFYRAVAGTQLVIDSEANNNLLANDEDDIDVRNLPLQSEIVRPPVHADVFELRADGGFTYQSSENLPWDNNESLIDSFVYRVSDGMHSVEGKATIELTSANQAPLPIGSLPDAHIELSSQNAHPTYSINVSPYFSDADNDTLSFEIDTDNLPEVLTLNIDDTGELSLEIAQPTADAIGTWSIGIVASDGAASTRSGFLLTVEGTTQQQSNRAPTASDISNRTVQGTFEYDITEFFNDPDGDTLTYSATRIPSGVLISRSGLLSGQSSTENRGDWYVQVTATDPDGESVTDGFLLRIR